MAPLEDVPDELAHHNGLEEDPITLQHARDRMTRTDDLNVSVFWRLSRINVRPQAQPTVLICHVEYDRATRHADRLPTHDLKRVLPDGCEFTAHTMSPLLDTLEDLPGTPVH
jgi:hypothetical protein